MRPRRLPTPPIEDLADSELRWRIAVESSEQGLWDLNNKTGAKFFSNGWYDMRGLERGSRTAQSMEEWLDCIHPDDRERVAAYVGRQDTGELAHISYQYRERHADGHWIWILSRGKPVTSDENGVPIRIIGTDTDITDLKSSEEDLERVSRRLELALSTSRVGVWEVDLTTRELNWDARMRELFGVPTTGPLPKDAWETVLHPDDRVRATAVAYEAVASHTDYSIDYRIVVGKETRHIRCRASYYGDPSGPKLIGVNWDVTSDYRRAQELERATVRAEQQNAELEAARSRMEFVSLHDALTGLPNRRHLDIKLAGAARIQRGTPRRLALLHIDLDRFKQINDTLGHAAGDAVLINAASMLKQTVGDRGLVARVGGDEFVILMENAPSDPALNELASAIIIRMLDPVQIDGHACRCGVSIGVAVAQGAQIDARKLLIDADIALYRAKSEGRNRCCFFNDEMQIEVVASKRAADEVLNGLEHGEFFAIYQPQFDARTLEISGVEALARWRHPQRGILGPETFLPVAEELSAVGRIDKIILQRAVDDMAMWRRQGLDIPRVSVNVSALRLRDEDLVHHLKSLKFPQNSLSFELLESIFLDEKDELVSWNIDHIREMGIAIEIDDFGTGHASILGLLNLRPNRLKIDRQLIASITESHEMRRLVASIVEIGKALDIKVVAEGVETVEHARILRKLGCDFLQGFAFARPMPVHEMMDFVAARRWPMAV